MQQTSIVENPCIRKQLTIGGMLTNRQSINYFTQRYLLPYNNYTQYFKPSGDGEWMLCDHVHIAISSDYDLDAFVLNIFISSKSTIAE